MDLATFESVYIDILVYFNILNKGYHDGTFMRLKNILSQWGDSISKMLNREHLTFTQTMRDVYVMPCSAEYRQIMWEVMSLKDAMYVYLDELRGH